MFGTRMPKMVRAPRQAARAAAPGRRAGGDQRAVVFRVARAGKRAERAGASGTRCASGEPRYLVMALTGVVRARVGSRNAIRRIGRCELIAEAHGNCRIVLAIRGRKDERSSRAASATRRTASGKKASKRLDTSIATFAACRGVRWEIETAQHACDTTRCTGWANGTSWPASCLAGCAEAEQRGDQYAINTVAVRFGPILAHGRRPARSGDEGVRRWPPASAGRRVSCSPHRLEVCSGIDLELVRRQSSAAAPSPDRSLAETGGRCAACGRTAESRCCFIVRASRSRWRRRRTIRQPAEQALARAHADADDARVPRRPGPKRSRRSVARRCATCEQARTQRTIARARGVRDRRLASCHMHHYAAAADYRRGMLMGSDAGRELVESHLTG